MSTDEWTKFSAWRDDYSRHSDPCAWPAWQASSALVAEEVTELKEAYALLFKANAELRASLGRPHVLHECLDNDSPWLICKHCGAVGRCEMEKS